MVVWWKLSDAPELAQGTLVRNCQIPVLLSFNESGIPEVEIQTVDAIVVTQSCDLAAKKVDFVHLCPVWSLEIIQARFPKSFPNRKSFENVRIGNAPPYHMLQSPENPGDNSQCLIVEFRNVHSLPLEYLTATVTKAGPRPTLLSPWVEHFSQAFARFFMRVGLPSDIPSFK